MDPLWATLAEVWWVAPAALGALGAGALGWAGVRGGRGRRLELDAAKDDVRRARDILARSRAVVHAARADVARAEADRAAGRSGAAEVSAARAGVRHAQREQTAAGAQLVARRADVSAARAAVPSRWQGADALPLARLMAAHDAVTSAWMTYETDPARAISYPSMTDARVPATTAFLDAQATAQWLRPTSAAARIRPAEYAAYRDAVREMARAFDAAERDARRRAGEPEPAARGESWTTIVQELWDGASRTVAWSAEAVARASATWGRRPPRPR